MKDADWDTLMRRMSAGRCVPFLGAGACAPTLPAARAIARRWADAHQYPLKDREDLAQVSQYLTVTREDALFAKEQMIDELSKAGEPDFDDPYEPHVALAKLPLPVYITTNYDSFMVEALKRSGRQPRQEVCRWTDDPVVTSLPSVFEDDPEWEPTAANPLVYHLHGSVDVPQSLVLTEDDYLEFLVVLSDKRKFTLPSPVLKAMSSHSLLFVGYSLRDWNFRVLHRTATRFGSSTSKRLSVTVQLSPDDELVSAQGNGKAPATLSAAQRYLDSYYGNMSMKVYWGPASEFARDLRARWQEFAR
jgi:hypothetical protein